MSCLACDEAQGTDESPELKNVTFVRVGRANILISGCEEHLKELIDKLRAAPPKVSNVGGDK